MGNCSLKTEDSEQSLTLSTKLFNFMYAVGRGGFGKVWKSSCPKGVCAVKQMSKSRVIQKRSVSSVFNELRFLSQLSSPFIVNMLYAFQDSAHLYMVLEFFEGGDLRYHLGRRLRFTEEETRFLVACLVLALEHLYSHEIVHRDIKPENLVFDSRGYLRLTDFGIARTLCPNNAGECSGTPGYMAPEVIFSKNYGFTADYFALGVIVYELATGSRPFPGLQREQIKIQIRENRPRLTKHQVDWSEESMDFCNRLIQKKPTDRLQTIKEIKEHTWLKNFSWENLKARKANPPFVPRSGDNFDPKHANREWKNYGRDLHRGMNVFQGYFYDHRYMRN